MAKMRPETTWPWRTLAIIPARRGSKGIPRKNLAPLAGKPLILYALEAALASERLKSGWLMASTDDPEIAALAGRYVEVPFLRPPELAQDDTPMLRVVEHAVRFAETQQGRRPDFVLLLQPTAPLRLPGDIDAALELLAATGADAVVSVCEVPDRYHPLFVLRIEEGRLRFNALDGERITRRQDLSPLYSRNGAIYAVRRDVLMTRGTLYGTDCRPYLMPPERSANIDTPLDLALAETLLAARRESSGTRTGR